MLLLAGLYRRRPFPQVTGSLNGKRTVLRYRAARLLLLDFVMLVEMQINLVNLVLANDWPLDAAGVHHQRAATFEITRVLLDLGDHSCVAIFLLTLLRAAIFEY